MNESPLRTRALPGLTCLLLLASFSASAASLQEEALKYRAEGYALQIRGDKVAALTMYRKAIAMDPSYAVPYNDMGIVLEEAGRLKEAQRAYEAALKLNPHYLPAHANLAMLYERSGERGNAIDHWRKRYQLGEQQDPWTIRAEDRLVALGEPIPEPPDEASQAGGMKVLGSEQTPREPRRRRAMRAEFRAHEQSIDDFHAVTAQSGPWP